MQYPRTGRGQALSSLESTLTRLTRNKVSQFVDCSYACTVDYSLVGAAGFEPATGRV